MPRTLITAATDAANSDAFIVGKGINKEDTDTLQEEEVTVQQQGLAGVETIDVQISYDGGSSWQDLYEDGSQIQLTTTITGLVVTGPGVFRVTKGVTAGAAGCYASTPSRP